MSTIDGEDRFIVQRGLTTYQLPATDMSTIQDEDWLLVARGSDHYKVSGADVLAQLGNGGGDGGGDSSRAAFEILEGPGAGSVIDLSDWSANPLNTFLFDPGQTYKIQARDTFLCDWDLVGEGKDGQRGAAFNYDSSQGPTKPPIPGIDTVVSSIFFTATAGAGSGGGGGNRGPGGDGIPGVAAVVGDVPGIGPEAPAVITSINGNFGVGGVDNGTGADAASVVPSVSLVDRALGEAVGAIGEVWSSYKAGGGGGGGGSFLRLSQMMMIRNMELDISLGPSNSGAGIRYLGLATAAARRAARQRLQAVVDSLKEQKDQTC